MILLSLSLSNDFSRTSIISLSLLLMLFSFLPSVLGTARCSGEEGLVGHRPYGGSSDIDRVRERLKPPNSSEIENLQSDTVETLLRCRWDAFEGERLSRDRLKVEWALTIELYKTKKINWNQLKSIKIGMIKEDQRSGCTNHLKFRTLKIEGLLWVRWQASFKHHLGFWSIDFIL